MKPFNGFFFITLVILFSLPQPGSALTLSVQDITGAPGDTVTVAVTLTDAAQVAAAAFKLSFDSSVAIPEDITATSSGDSFLVETYTTPVSVSLAIARGETTSNPSGEQVRLQFQIPDTQTNGSTTTIKVNNAAAYDSSGDTVSVASNDGSITVSDGSDSDDGGGGGGGGGGGCYITTLLAP